MIDEAVQTAKQSDVVVAVVGEAQGMAHVASSRTDMTIPQSQRDLIAALKATGKPLVLVRMNGFAGAGERRLAGDAIPEPGLRGLKAVMQLPMYCLAITTRPGKLPMSFPRSCRSDPGVLQPSEYRGPYNADKPNKYTSRYFDEANGAFIRLAMV
ncbi:glycoside hydrolase family 3 C-terminal domain-containing protein [Shigella flexneri]